MLRLALLLTLVLPLPALAGPRVVADIAPVQSLVARVMQGQGMPEVLVRPGASPHDYALRPSEAEMLAAAEAVFVVGPSLSPWLTGPLAALPRSAYVMELAEVPGLPVAPGPVAGDPHLWLDPAVAAAWLPVIADVLAESDPANAAAYRANAEAGQAELAALEAEIAGRMRPLAGRGYMVFHDAYRHFEARFGLTGLGAIQGSDAHLPGAGHFAGLRDIVLAKGTLCVFTEPQFSPRLAEQLVEGTAARLAVLDPLGAAIAPGPGLYPQLMRGLADSFAACLSP